MTPCEHCQHYPVECYLCQTPVCPDTVNWLIIPELAYLDPLYFCASCWAAGKDFQALIEIEQKRHDDALAEYLKGWARAVERNKED